MATGLVEHGRRQLQARVRRRWRKAAGRASRRGVNLPLAIRAAQSERTCTHANESTESTATQATSSLQPPHNPTVRPCMCCIVLNGWPTDPYHVHTADLVSELLHTGAVE